MSLKTKSVHRQEVLDRALVAIESALRDGGMIAAGVIAQHLLDEDPKCSLSPAELRDDIARLAVQRGVGIEFG